MTMHRPSLVTSIGPSPVRGFMAAMDSPLVWGSRRAAGPTDHYRPWRLGGARRLGLPSDQLRAGPLLGRLARGEGLTELLQLGVKSRDALLLVGKRLAELVATTL